MDGATGMQFWTQRLDEIAAEQGYTRQEIADAMGVSRGYVSRLLKGRQGMTLSTFEGLCIALGVRVKLVAPPKPRQRKKGG